jgi:PAS domain S-box-containing protein
LGLLRLDSDCPGKFSIEDAERLEPLINAAAVSLEKSYLYGQAQKEITERKRAEEALRESEERYRAIFEQAADAIVLIDVESGALEFNDMAHNNLGYTRQEFRKLRLPDIEIVKSATEIRKHFQKIIKEGADTFETKHRAKTGELRDVLVSSRAISIGGKQFLLNLWNDITERKQAEKEIRRLNQELEQRVADRTQELSTLYDVTTVVNESLELNRALERILEQVRKVTKSHAAAIHLVDEGGENLHLTAHRGQTLGFIASTNIELNDNNTVRKVLKTGLPAVGNYVEIDHLFGEAEAAIEHAIAPVRSRGQAIGLLSVLRSGGRKFNVEQVALLTTIADQIGVVVENTRLRQMEKQAAVIEERERLAQDLHDSVTQLLYSLTLFAEAGREEARARKSKMVASTLEEIGKIALQSLKEMRLLVYELRPHALEQDGLVAALQHRLDAVERRGGMETHLAAELGTTMLPAPLEEELYRIAEEALNNSLKHAGATTINVHICATEDQVELEVTDNGYGFETGEISDKAGMGLINMQKRAEALGGSLSVSSTPGKGTTVKAVVNVAERF